MIASDPDVMGGTPCIRGTRIPAILVALAVADGIGDAEIMRLWPTLPEGAIQAAVEWAKARKEA